jgi:hypothetical protein
VSDPLCHPPFFAPWSSWRGSLTPNIDVTLVRTNGACPGQMASTPHDSAATRPAFTATAQSLTGFAGNSRSYR